MDAGDVMRLSRVATAHVCTAIDRLVVGRVLRPIVQSQRNAVWAAGDVLDEADLVLERLRVRRLRPGA